MWDADELDDLTTNPEQTNNLLFDPASKTVAKELEDRLDTMLSDEGGMDIPMNKPRDGSANKRLKRDGAETAAELPGALIVPEPIRKFK